MTHSGMSLDSIRERWWKIVFESDTPAGKAFDVLLLVAIVLSVLTVFLESIVRLEIRYGEYFLALEWIFTALFTIEYLLRLWLARKPLRYATSFFGIVDLLAVLPTYISLILPGTHYLLTIRVLRVIRVFRVFKLVDHLKESRIILEALRASRMKITVFLTAVLLLVVFIGSLLYVVEAGSNSGFDSIPRSMYWAIVTLTTVGYGDISPATPLGQFLAAVVMVLGYSIIAVPTGIVSVAMSQATHQATTMRVCAHCMTEDHRDSAEFCYQCGTKLPDRGN